MIFDAAQTAGKAKKFIKLLNNNQNIRTITQQQQTFLQK